MSTQWSAEARLVMNPVATFRDLVREEDGGTWTLVRRPLNFLFVLGCVVSMLASGRLSVRLIVDGMVSFAFIPVFELVALAAVFRSRPQPVRFSRALDLFFAANAPWLLWAIALIAFRSVLTPLQASSPPPWAFGTVLGSLVPPAIWAARLDKYFFREVLASPRATRDLLIQRAISWTCAITYFLGIAIWPEIVGRLPL